MLSLKSMTMLSSSPRLRIFTKFDFRNSANIVPYDAFENLRRLNTFFNKNFDFRFSANTQMDNDVTPVYLAAQVSRA